MEACCVASDNFDPSRHLDAEFSYGLDALDGAATVSRPSA